MNSEDFEHHLERALGSRPVIEQAKGVLAALRSATPEQAFAELVQASQNHNVKLNLLAGALVAAASGCAAEDARLRHAVWVEWGPCLDGRVPPPADEPARSRLSRPASPRVLAARPLGPDASPRAPQHLAEQEPRGRGRA